MVREDGRPIAATDRPRPRLDDLADPGFIACIGALHIGAPSGWQESSYRTLRANARISRTKISGSSNAAKWPPRSVSFQ